MTGTLYPRGRRRKRAVVPASAARRHCRAPGLARGAVEYGRRGGGRTTFRFRGRFLSGSGDRGGREQWRFIATAGGARSEGGALGEEGGIDQEVVVSVDYLVEVEITLRVQRVRRWIEESAVDLEVVVGVNAPVGVGVAVVAEFHEHVRGLLYRGQPRVGRRGGRSDAGALPRGRACAGGGEQPLDEGDRRVCDPQVGGAEVEALAVELRDAPEDQRPPVSVDQADTVVSRRIAENEAAVDRDVAAAHV